LIKTANTPSKNLVDMPSMSPGKNVSTFSEDVPTLKPSKRGNNTREVSNNARDNLRISNGRHEKHHINVPDKMDRSKLDKRYIENSERCSTGQSQARTINVSILPARRVGDRRATSRCEKLLGIVPGSFNSILELNFESPVVDDGRIMVVEMLPMCPASKSGLEIGQ